MTGPVEIAPGQPKLDYARWAREKLNLGAQSTPAEARLAFLRAVGAAQCNPVPGLFEAFDLLRDREAAAAAATARIEIEAELRKEVDSFAQTFFAASSAQRRRRLHTLLEECRWLPPLAARLHALKPGLDVDIAAVRNEGVADDGMAAELAEHIAEVFVLRVAGQARRRGELLNQFELNRALWAKAARKLRDDHPDIVGLAPALIEDLVEQPAVNRQMVKQIKRRVAQTVPASKGGWNWASSGWISLVIFGIITMARIASQDSARKPDPALKLPVLKLDDLKKLEKDKDAPRWILKDRKLELHEDPRLPVGKGKAPAGVKGLPAPPPRNKLP